MKRFLSCILAVTLLLTSQITTAQTSVVNSVNNVHNKAATYTASSGFTLASTPTDFFTISGSATKTVYVKALSLTCYKDSAAYSPLTLMKRSTANSGGTATTLTAVAHDSTNSSATATVRAYTANPTVGTGVSFTRVLTPFVVSGTITEAGPRTFRWGDYIDQYVVLRGTAQSLTVNGEGETLTGAICQASVTWIEQ